MIQQARAVLRIPRSEPMLNLVLVIGGFIGVAALILIRQRLYG